MFFLIPFASESWEEPSQQTFILVKTYWRRFESLTFFVLQDILKTSWRRLAKRSWKRLEDVLKTFLEEVLQIRLEDIFKSSWKTKNCYAQDVLENKKCLLGCYFALINNIFFRTIMRLNSFRYASKVIIVFSCYRI